MFINIVVYISTTEFYILAQPLENKKGGEGRTRK